MTTIGTPVRQREDYRFLTGQGNYTDDINRPNQLYAHIQRGAERDRRAKSPLIRMPRWFG